MTLITFDMLYAVEINQNTYAHKFKYGNVIKNIYIVGTTPATVTCTNSDSKSYNKQQQ